MTGLPAVAVFAGPSLAGSAFADVFQHLLRPPVCAGDLAAAAATIRPGGLLLVIDGEFGQSQAVTISEIRAVLDAGYQVWGAASMGALRAVECGELGMVGLGRIWADYAAGRLVADDEVALTYDPESYRPVTVPLVNVRGLIGLLRGTGAPADACRQVLARARAVHFRDRSLTALRRILAECLTGDPLALATRLLAADAQATWNVKLSDAEQAVTAALTGLPAAAPAPGPVPADPALLLAGADW